MPANVNGDGRLQEFFANAARQVVWKGLRTAGQLLCMLLCMLLCTLLGMLLMSSCRLRCLRCLRTITAWIACIANHHHALAVSSYSQFLQHNVYSSFRNGVEVATDALVS